MKRKAYMSKMLDAQDHIPMLLILENTFFCQVRHRLIRKRVKL